jgi:hypothetical protein
MRIIVVRTLSLLMGCNTNTNYDKPPIGYIGFNGNTSWAIQFNDCTEYEFRGAEKYLWYDRKLTSISCYQFKSDDKIDLKNQEIQIYKSPTLNAPRKSINEFSELKVSESGWGTFPNVYETVNGDWFRVKEGWIHLEPKDKEFVRFYKGAQSRAENTAHDNYFNNH